MLHIVILTLALTTLALVHFIESLYTSIKILQGNAYLTTPCLPETPLALYIRKRYVPLRAQELLDAKARIARAIGGVALSADVKQNSGYGNNSSHVIHVTAATRPLPIAQVDTAPLVSRAANEMINDSVQPSSGTPSRDASIASNAPRKASNTSVWLAALQALLGVFVTQTFLVRQLSGINSDCSFPTMSFVVCFTFGITCILLAYAHQVYVVDGEFSKRFVSIILAIFVNFFPLVVFATGIQVGLADQSLHVCLANFIPSTEWIKYFPLASSVVVMLVCAAIASSFLHAAYMLCLESACYLPREIALVMIHYRGIGLLFVGGLVGAIVSATILVLVATGYFDLGLCWLAQWAIMSRLLTTGLWYRAKVDSVAHAHKFWKSFSFFWGYLRYHQDIKDICANRMV